MSRYRIRLFVAGAVGLLVAVACGAPPPGAQATGSQQVQLAAVQELTVATTTDTYRNDDRRTNIGMYPLNANIFDTLVTLSPTYEVLPGLATKWELRPPNTYRFTLRQGVKFHDGTPFTAKDVVWSLQRIAKQGGGTVGVNDKSAVLVDDYTVDITPKAQNLRALQQLVHPSWSIAKAESETTKAMGTGPFKLVEYSKEQRIVVAANDDYWGGKPTLRKITFRFIPDGNTRALALQAGEVQISDILKESAKTITGDFSVSRSKVGAYEAIYINVRGKEGYDLGKDAAVRQAIAYGIDKKVVVDSVWQGNAEVNQTMIPPAILGSEGSRITGTNRDVAKAKKLLDDAGWKPAADGIREKNGRKLSLTMVVGFPNAETHRPMPEFAQSQFKEIGIDVKIVTTPDTTSYEARLAKGEGDLWVEAGSQNDANPCFLPALLFSSPDPAGDEESNMYGNAFALGAAFDANIKRCNEATTTADVQKAAADSMKLLVDEQFVVVPLAGTYRINGISKKVLEFTVHPAGVHQRWDSVKLAK
jgi:peptide/nickel transport system substrate-binding protein